MKIKLTLYIALLFIGLGTGNIFSQNKDLRGFKNNTDRYKIEKSIRELPQRKAYPEKDVKTFQRIVKKNQFVKAVRRAPEKEKYVTKKVKVNAVKIETNPDFYSVFTDFRIPIRENINESDLRYENWRTDPALYTFRCKNEERVRLTYWTLGKNHEKFPGSEFINVTADSEKCLESDIAFAHKIDKPKTKPRKKASPITTSDSEVTTEVQKEKKVTKFKKDLKKKKKKKWEGQKK